MKKELIVAILIFGISAMVYSECQQWTQNGNQLTCTNDPSADPLRNGQFANSMNNAGGAIGAAIARAKVNQSVQQQVQEQDSEQDYQPTAAQLDRRNHPEEYDATPPKRGHLGLKLIPTQEAAKLDLSISTIYSVVPGGPADKAGLHGGDVIRSIAGITIQGNDSLLKALQSVKPGDSTLIAFTRHGEEKVTTVVLN